MIDPFEDRQVREGVISYGVSSYGYDMRVAREFRIFTNVLNSVVDPKAFDPRSFVEFEGDVCIVPPNSFALARSVEYFRIPRDVLTITVGKSTYARCGIITNVTPFEPEWEGYVTLEISNTTPLPAKIYANEGIAQVVFFTGDEPPAVSYGDKKGKYQGQHGVTLPRICGAPAARDRGAGPSRPRPPLAWQLPRRAARAVTPPRRRPPGAPAAARSPSGSPGSCA
jgi:dCTP deaminase